jgi:hypothetical protein
MHLGPIRAIVGENASMSEDRSVPGRERVQSKEVR